MEGNALLFLAFFILFSKIITDTFSRINLPPVLGMILIGLLVGPTGFNLLSDHEDISRLHFFADIGVLILMFMAGLETNINDMKKIGKNALIIALAGIIVPFIGGFLVTWYFYQDIMVGVMMGLVLTATSVSVSVMALMDMKKFNTVEGSTILGAAILDDIIGIIILTIVLGMTGKGEHGVGYSITMIVLYIGVGSAVGIFLFPILLKWVDALKSEVPVITTALALLFLFAWAAEHAEVAAITGAYMAGLFIGQTRFKHRIEEGVNTIGQALFVSLFFIFIGFDTNLRGGNLNWMFTLAFLGVAIITKMIGAGIAARALGFDWRRSMVIGSGMIPRGEVGLVVASLVTLEKGGYLTPEQFSAVVFMVIGTAFITPFLLKVFFKDRADTLQLTKE